MLRGDPCQHVRLRLPRDGTRHAAAGTPYAVTVGGVGAVPRVGDGAPLTAALYAPGPLQR